MAKEQQLDPGITSLLSDFHTRLRDIEEKQRLIKDRVLLIGENLVSSKENSTEEIAELKIKVENIEREMQRLKEVISSIIEDTKNYARKSELEILQRQFEMFQPLIKKY